MSAPWEELTAEAVARRLAGAGRYLLLVHTKPDGDCLGTIAYTPMGDDGFGYNPVFFVPDKRKTFAQMTLEERSAISHRGNALRKFKEILAEYLKK